MVLDQGDSMSIQQSEFNITVTKETKEIWHLAMFRILQKIHYIQRIVLGDCSRFCKPIIINKIFSPGIRVNPGTELQHWSFTRPTLVTIFRWEAILKKFICYPECMFDIPFEVNSTYSNSFTHLYVKAKLSGSLLARRSVSHLPQGIIIITNSK